MTEVFGLDTGIDLGVTGGLAGFAVYLAWIFGILVLAIIGGVIFWIWHQKKIFKEEIVVFENVSGQGWVIAFKDRARRLRLSKDGTEVLWLKKKKMPLTAYGRKMGTNQYWFAIGQDGGWYNFLLGDLDAKMGVLDIEPVDRDIKYVTVAMLKNAEKEYGPKQSFMDKWGVWIFSLLGLIIGIAGFAYLIDQMGQVAGSLSNALDANTKTAEVINTALAHVDSLCNGGTGITTVG
jgi:hypothetical protein